jgi:hypothetical protein
MYGRRRSPVTGDAQPRTSDHNGPTKFARRVHLAQEAWTNKVDTKGAILLALQGGALFTILSASGKNRRLTSPEPRFLGSTNR